MSFPEGRRRATPGARPASRTRRPGGDPGTPDPQTLRIRRTIALVGAIVFVILLVLGINSCLNNRKDSAFRSYASDVRALVRNEQELSKRFFATLSNPPKGDALDVQTQVNAERVDAEQFVQRAKDLSHPGELNTANGWLVTAFQFRADAIARIADRLPTALGDKDRKPAIDSIAGQMQALLASDVIYLQRTIPALTSAFNKRSIQESFPAVRFLPDLGWLDPTTVQSRLDKLTGASKTTTPGLHGTSLQGVVAQPAGTALNQSGVNRIPISGQLSFDVKVQNGGDSDETQVGVSLAITDGKKISVDQTIPRIASGQTETVSIPVTQQPQTGAVSTLTVQVQPVPGESNKDNNKASYQVVFTGGQ